VGVAVANLSSNFCFGSYTGFKSNHSVSHQVLQESWADA